eukprot:2927292-Alexandrium_andersonii.AAC.1
MARATLALRSAPHLLYSSTTGFGTLNLLTAFTLCAKQKCALMGLCVSYTSSSGTSTRLSLAAIAALTSIKSIRLKPLAPWARHVPEQRPCPSRPGTSSTSNSLRSASASATAGYSPSGPLKSPHRTMGKSLQVAISATTSASMA